MEKPVYIRGLFLLSGALLNIERFFDSSLAKYP